MAATKCWVWRKAQGESAFRHPADIPVSNVEDAKAAFVDKKRGPRTCRLCPVTVVKASGNVVTINEKGRQVDVPKHCLLPWFEGLFLLEEIEEAQAQKHPGMIPVHWMDDELRSLLQRERKNLATPKLRTVALKYAEKRLRVAVTGSRFVDSNDKEWNYRRENIKAEEVALTSKEDESPFWKLKDLTGYAPPWEAFLSEKCGFYQDFFKVHWEAPSAGVDYSNVENGAKEAGSTWEPDECIPAHMDFLRLAAKRKWIKDQVEAVKMARQKLRDDLGASPIADKSDEDGPPAKRARTRRDGRPLDRDVIRAGVGHDWIPALDATQVQVRSGWPKRLEDYPKGFGVASPPGFCFATCDCMDDARQQKIWETQKAWIEDPQRSVLVQQAIANFSNQASFVRRRGQVSGQNYFETLSGAMRDSTAANAAGDLGEMIKQSLRMVLQAIPLASLSEAKPRVHLPGRVFLPEDDDYEPLTFAIAACDAKGNAIPAPSWLAIHPDNGQFRVKSPPEEADLPLQLKVEMSHAEGPCTQEVCSIVKGPAVAWKQETIKIAQLYYSSIRCPLEKGVRQALQVIFQDIFDFTQMAPREVKLGRWVHQMSRIHRQCRAASGARLELSLQGRP